MKTQGVIQPAQGHRVVAEDRGHSDGMIYICFPLFYNKDYDLGKYLEPTPSPSKNSQISLSSMNISTKNITPPISEPTPKHDFLFIKK